MQEDELNGCTHQHFFTFVSGMDWSDCTIRTGWELDAFSGKSMLSSGRIGADSSVPYQRKVDTIAPEADVPPDVKTWC